MAMQYNSSEAYDFALFQPKHQLDDPKENNNIIELPKERLNARHRSKLRPLKVASMVLFLVGMLGIVGSIVYGQVRLTELTEGVNVATKQLSESQSLYTQLQMKSNAKLSLDTVEYYAENKLGMRKIEQNQIEYVSLADGDKGQVIEKNHNMGWMDSINSYVHGLLS